ncbi:MAG: 16S rRNA (cytosine(1402)-N(4))-methyltransferase RsmH [Casimicrobiaceae bacterium]|nr:16S rRNA (cytosine(1402)-N(4))-methyltransferase RsmH [Casimicrobiaceae bacterium]MDW8311542.1 16S rRNA (cytosine(1402)-N(4))-methyltransferase RsmH [Burkholderiales bacterium]
MAAHTPVLLDEVVEALQPSRCTLLVDATFGRGGHARALLAAMRSDARLIALDRDEAAEQEAARIEDPRFSFVRARFSTLIETLRRAGIEAQGRVDALLFDLGVSSPQLEEAQRGFSFLRDGPLDMRMDRSGGETAAEWLARADPAEIRRVLSEFGEERFAARIAEAIAAQRRRQPIRRTRELAALVEACVPTRRRGHHPATRTFQALRIHINRELEELEMALNQVPDLLAPGGRVAFITFHSLEDRCVKTWMRRESGAMALDPALRRLPLPPSQPARARLKPIGRDRAPSAEEIARNPRARSARLRVAERLPW